MDPVFLLLDHTKMHRVTLAQRTACDFESARLGAAARSPEWIEQADWTDAWSRTNNRAWSTSHDDQALNPVNGWWSESFGKAMS